MDGEEGALADKWVGGWIDARRECLLQWVGPGVLRISSATAFFQGSALKQGLYVCRQPQALGINMLHNTENCSHRPSDLQSTEHFPVLLRFDHQSF